jgi:hypothetical protein
MSERKLPCHMAVASEIDLRRTLDLVLTVTDSIRSAALNDRVVHVVHDQRSISSLTQAIPSINNFTVLFILHQLKKVMNRPLDQLRYPVFLYPPSASLLQLCQDGTSSPAISRENSSHPSPALTPAPSLRPDWIILWRSLLPVLMHLLLRTA